MSWAYFNRVAEMQGENERIQRGYRKGDRDQTALSYLRAAVTSAVNSAPAGTFDEGFSVDFAAVGALREGSRRRD